MLNRIKARLEMGKAVPATVLIAIGGLSLTACGDQESRVIKTDPVTGEENVATAPQTPGQTETSPDTTHEIPEGAKTLSEEVVEEGTERVTEESTTENTEEDSSYEIPPEFMSNPAEFTGLTRTQLNGMFEDDLAPYLNYVDPNTGESGFIYVLSGYLSAIANAPDHQEASIPFDGVATSYDDPTLVQLRDFVNSRANPSKDTRISVTLAPVGNSAYAMGYPSSTQIVTPAVKNTYEYLTNNYSFGFMTLSEDPGTGSFLNREDHFFADINIKGATKLNVSSGQGGNKGHIVLDGLAQ